MRKFVQIIVNLYVIREHFDLNDIQFQDPVDDQITLSSRN